MRCLFLISFLVAIGVHGQESFKLKGNVTDLEGNPIPIGDVLLYDEQENVLIRYTTMVDGHFYFENVSSSTYNIKISSLGFNDFKRTVNLNKDIDLSILLEEKATQLDNVELVVSKNPITTNNGNITIDVSNPVFSSLADPLDVLSRLPNVQISPDRESITVIAKGTPLIYIGRQRIEFEEFMALSVDAIQSIELINNPSAKYEAEGRAVLVVTLKNNVERGTKINLSETLSSRKNLNNYFSANGNHSNGKWNLRANLNYNQLGQWESNSFAFDIPTEDIFSDYLVLVSKNNRTQINAGLGWYLPLSDKDYLSLNTTLRRQTDKAPIDTETFLQNGGQQDFILTETNNDNSKVYESANLNFNKKLSHNLNLFAGLQFSQFTQKLASEISNNFNNTAFQLDQKRNQRYRIGALALRIDMEHEITEGTKAEFGGSWSNINADAFTLIEEPPTLAGDLTQYDYQESLYAAYFDLSSKMGDKLSFNVGARTEDNRVTGILNKDEQPLIERNNFRLFPKAGVIYQLDSTKTLSINYAKAITRPNFSRTSTIAVFINPFLEGTNNINILPTLTQEVTSNLQLKGKSIFLGIYRNTNPVSFAISFEEGDGAATLSPINLDKEMGMYLGATLPYSHKKWTTTNTISINYNKLEDNGAELLETKPYLYAYTNHQFRIARDTVVSLGGWYLSKRREGIFQRNSLLFLEASITKKIGSFDCALRFNDITRGLNFEERYSINGIEAEGIYFGDAREMAVSVKYSFGKNKSSDFKNRDVDENLDRIN
ncbi:TonB-dependent receptor [Flagellimonas meishanensis]|uniref:TonB-dependent receptor n=1 Tax=Flagellimonas meishanensis TaxID=2873264 RepID=UPI001CA66B39|nr:TonB-dependent receptor [[Muricauda] meishanensis]